MTYNPRGTGDGWVGGRKDIGHPFLLRICIQGRIGQVFLVHYRTGRQAESLPAAFHFTYIYIYEYIPGRLRPHRTWFLEQIRIS